MRINLNKQILMPIILFVGLFINEDILVFGTINNPTLQNFRLAVQMCLVVFLFGYMILNNIGIPKRKFHVFCLFSFFYITSMIVNMDFREGYIFMLLIYFICLELTTIYTFDDIYMYFSKVMFVICIASLVGYFIQMIIPDALNIFPVIENTGHNSFYFMGLTNLCFRTDTLVRNWGPFREPGVFQLFIIVALVYSLFRDKKSNWVKLWVYIIAILTTFSTTGYIALGLVMLATVALNKDNMTKDRKNLLIGTLLVVIVFTLYLSLFTELLFKSDGYGSVFGKIFGSYESLSYNARLASVWANIRMAMLDPIFGKGITFVEDNYSFIASGIYGMTIMDNTNTAFILLARFGIFAFVYFFIRLYISIRESYKLNHLSTLLIFGTYLTIMAGENLAYSVIMALPLFVMNCDVDKKAICEVDYELYK